MIVITGGAGFIGSALVWGLNQRGREDILVVDSLGRDDRWKNLVNLRIADYLDRDDFLGQLKHSLPAPDIEGVIHMGACSSTTERDADFLMKNNYEYTNRLALWCVEHDKRFVYASSAATYGDGSRGFSDAHEDMEKLQPLNAYGFSKYLSDMWAWRRDLLDSIAGLKYFNVFGPNEYHKEDMRSVVHKAYEQIAATGKVRLFKSCHDDYQDGWQLRDFIYVKDVVSATLAIYDNPRANGIYNIGAGQARSFYDLTTAVFNAMDITPDIEYIDMPEQIRDRYQYFTQAKTDKLRTAWQGQTHTLEDAISDYIKNYLLTNDPYLK
ncbi:MAG: ADP-glyceromanno-heptose 6-epimerase [Sedimentisphaerales bacterium]|nr:ADP-glyceromanno-heptose 6-epimerase [Sedimentisphaerales bacterium]